jgi:hypothetical protein
MEPAREGLGQGCRPAGLAKAAKKKLPKAELEQSPAAAYTLLENFSNLHCRHFPGPPKIAESSDASSSTPPGEKRRRSFLAREALFDLRSGQDLDCHWPL